MAINLNDLANALTGAQERPAAPRASRDQYGTIALDAEGTPTVMLDGGTDYAPCTCMVGVHHGDRVLAHVVNHKIVVFANITAPTTDDATALVAIDRADVAAEAADAAGIAAASAQEDAATAKADAATAKASAASAVSDAKAAKSAATQAQTDASSAAQSAQSAQADAQAASTSAQQAQADASSASTSAGQAAASASQAAESASQAQADATTASNAATQAQGSASQAAGSATSAQQQAQAAKAAADGAVSDAAEAKTAAGEARTAAGEARTAATKAQEDASKANTAANTALIQASIVEDVAGTLQWIKEHGQYVATSDTTVQDGTVYFQYNSTTGDYEPIVNPTGNPMSQGWFTLDITDAQSDFIMSHLAVTGRGLWVLPNGIGSHTTPGSGESQSDSDARQGSGYKLLLSSDGTYIYDSAGNLVITYGANITPSVDRPFYIGDPNSTSYIVFIPASGSSPASIRIGGSVSIGGGKTLSQILSEVEQKADS